MITIQYLADAPGVTGLEPREAAEKLGRALERLPISHVLIGWNLPAAVREACRRACERAGVRFLRWQPLLTSDASLEVRPEWQVVGLGGERVPGFQEQPDFTFACPNHPEAAGAILEHLDRLAASGAYQGFFLDRVRLPSPAADPRTHLGCFCAYCREAAAAEGLDLEAARREIAALIETRAGRAAIVRGLLGQAAPQAGGGGRETQSASLEASLLERWLHFRAASVTRFVGQAAERLRAAGLEVGLDCFSAGLAWMVGQDLGALGSHADWIKVMSYAHTLGPAGLPFELLGLLDFLGPPEHAALRLMGEALALPMPASREALEKEGLSAAALASEVAQACRATPAPALAGIELVQIPGLAELSDEQIRRDLRAVRDARPAGLALSWDLFHIPLERLELVRQAGWGLRGVT